MKSSSSSSRKRSSRKEEEHQQQKPDDSDESCKKNLSDCKKITTELKQEIANLKQQLKTYESNNSSRKSSNRSENRLDSDEEEHSELYKNSIRFIKSQLTFEHKLLFLKDLIRNNNLDDETQLPKDLKILYDTYKKEVDENIKKEKNEKEKQQKYQIYIKKIFNNEFIQSLTYEELYYDYKKLFKKIKEKLEIVKVQVKNGYISYELYNAIIDYLTTDDFQKAIYNENNKKTIIANMPRNTMQIKEEDLKKHLESMKQKFTKQMLKFEHGISEITENHNFMSEVNTDYQVLPMNLQKINDLADKLQKMDESAEEFKLLKTTAINNLRDLLKEKDKTTGKSFNPYPETPRQDNAVAKKKFNKSMENYSNNKLRNLRNNCKKEYQKYNPDTPFCKFINQFKQYTDIESQATNKEEVNKKLHPVNKNNSNHSALSELLLKKQKGLNNNIKSAKKQSALSELLEKKLNTNNVLLPTV